MNLVGSKTNQCQLHEKIVSDFASDYINYINRDIFTVIEYYKQNNMQTELMSIEAILARLSSNISVYLTQIKIPEKIIRLGDMHCVNRCTVLIEYQNRTIIYKPIQSHFLNLINELLTILNSTDEFHFYLLKILSEDQHGTTLEYLQNEEINDINKFSYHYGGVIFILTLLRGTDFHADNILTICSTPVIVDYETLFYPKIAEFKDYDVTATALIKTEHNSHTLMHRYHLNLNQIIKGINSAYDIVKNNHKIVDLIKTYHTQLTRVIFKPTKYYLDLLKNSTHPALLSDENRRRAYLAKSLSGEKKISSFIIEHEIEDIINFNIPLFYFKEGNLISSQKAIIHQNLVSSPLDLILDEIKHLDLFKNKMINTMRAI